MAGNEGNVELQKGKEDSVTYQTTNISSEWQVNGNNLTNSSMRMIPINSSMMESASCSPMVDSFSMPIWDPSIHEAGTSSNLGVRTGMDWSGSNSMLRGGMFLPPVQGMVPQNMPHFPADSGFIVRAARYSCFTGGNFGEAMNPFNVLNPYAQGLGPVPGPHDVLGGGGSKLLETNMMSVSKEASLHGASGNEGSPYKNEKKTEGYNSHDEAKHGANTSGNESNEAEFSGRGGQEESSRKATSSKKRKRTGKDTNDHNQSPKPSTEEANDTTVVKPKDDQNPTVTKPGGKNSKEGSQGSDVPKEEYIHMRARRGQATNSHSLAERVRREKISERMKFLQDLVPGCSKVTGKAVMLDEIINYVQSLQRQVEFLSMKLATVNPRQLDFNIEGLLAKDILQPRGGLSSSLPFHPHDMATIPFPSTHPSQPGLMQAGLPGLSNSSEALRRLMNFQPGGGFKDHASQSAWEDELHNIVHMGLNSNAAFSSQDLTDSLQPHHTKDEP